MALTEVGLRDLHTSDSLLHPRLHLRPSDGHWDSILCAADPPCLGAAKVRESRSKAADDEHDRLRRSLWLGANASRRANAAMSMADTWL